MWKALIVFVIVSIADLEKADFHGLEPQDYAATLKFEKSYPTH